MIWKNNDGNTQHFTNTTSTIITSSQISPITPHSNFYWIIDSGVTNHVISSFELLNPKVLITRNKYWCVKWWLDIYWINWFIILYITPQNKFNEVLKVPQFQINLLLASKLTQTLNYIITFFFDFCV